MIFPWYSSIALSPLCFLSFRVQRPCQLILGALQDGDQGCPVRGAGISYDLLKPLQEGKQTLHLQFTGGSCNIDKIVLTCTSEDGIETVILNDPSESSHNLYNLAGQKVDANYKGIVVKNGRKMITK